MNYLRESNQYDIGDEQLVDAEIQIQFSKIQEMFQFQLKRFDYKFEFYESIKINKCIKTSLILDLYEYFLNDFIICSIFELYSLLIHDD
jgi:hypothetical protein